MPTPFTIHVSDEVLADLRQRISRTRWPDEVDDAGWDYGTNLGYLRELLAYWADGFDCSDRPRRRGTTKTRVAALWAELMTRHLGYERFAVRGGDIGSGISAFLGLDHPQHVVGVHVSDAIRNPYLGPGARPLTTAEERFLAEEADWMRREGAYDHMQATKPQTLAYGLFDSPAGLAAWIVEKLRSWSDCGGDVERRFSRDEILTQLTIYWATGTIHSANRMYFERD